MSAPASDTVPRVRGTSPSMARSVVVLPTPFRPRSAVTAALGDVEADALEHLRLAQVGVQIGHGQGGWRDHRAHSGSPR